jgi:hypothetical protein
LLFVGAFFERPETHKQWIDNLRLSYCYLFPWMFYSCAVCSVVLHYRFTAAQHSPTAYRVNLAAQRKRSITLISSSFGWAYIFSEICTFEREEHIFIRAFHLSLSPAAV